MFFGKKAYNYFDKIASPFNILIEDSNRRMVLVLFKFGIERF